MLTLLALLVGFSFSMAISRYDQRKNYEAAEANAIGTEYVRAQLLPAESGGAVRELLKSYVEQRVLFYTTREESALGRINAETSRLQNEMWSAAHGGALAQPNPVTALAVSGMNDVLDSQGFAQAAAWNRIPAAAWALLMAVGASCNLLLGYGARATAWRIFLVLPIALAVAFCLIADIDSPRSGSIRVTPQNLLSVSGSLHGH